MNVAEIIPLADTWGMHGDVGWGWMALMMAVMVLFWGAVIFGIVWLFRSVAGGGPAPSGETPVSRETAVEILERRFAEGALTLEDYRARREGSSTGPPNRTLPQRHAEGDLLRRTRKTVTKEWESPGGPQVVTAASDQAAAVQVVASAAPSNAVGPSKEVWE